MSAERMSIGPFFDELRSALETLGKLPRADEPITRDDLDTAQDASRALRQWITDHAGLEFGAERTVAVKVLTQVRKAVKRDWECLECGARFDLDFKALEAEGEEPHCSECGSVDLEPAGLGLARTE